MDEVAQRHNCLNEIDNFLDKKDLQMGGTQLKFASAMPLPYHGFVESQKKTKNREKPKPENITEEIREKEAE